jgi:hypothetical protein
MSKSQPVLIGVRVFQRMLVFCLQFYGWEKGVLYKIIVGIGNIFWGVLDL